MAFKKDNLENSKIIKRYRAKAQTRYARIPFYDSLRTDSAIEKSVIADLYQIIMLWTTAIKTVVKRNAWLSEMRHGNDHKSLQMSKRYL